MARDEFPKSVIERLRLRVSGRCSNPECRVPTTGPSGDEDKVTITGVAAHISAASPGGPRYSAEITTKDRKSIRNAIWLCVNCSVKIDRDEEKYTVAVLNQWKKRAEETDSEEQGKKLPDNNDAINTLTAALSGNSKTLVPFAISNVHKAVTCALEELDNRFVITSAHSVDGTCFHISAKETVKFSMQIEGSYAEEYIDKYKRLLEHGEDLEILASAVKFEGSKLIEEISEMTKDGRLVISAEKRKGIQKVWLVDPDTSVIESFEDIPGEITSGEKSITFYGMACNDLFTFQCRRTLVADEANVIFSINLEKWLGCDIRHLPFFSKLLSFFEKLSSGWELFTALEIDGIRFHESRGTNLCKLDFVTEARSLLVYIDKVSIISGYLGMPIKFKPAFSFTTEEIRRLIDIADIMEGKQKFFEKDLTSNPSCSLIADTGASNIELVKNRKEPVYLKIVEVNNDSMTCFGITITLPKKAFILTSVIPILHSSQDTYTEGDIVQVEWVPCSGFACKIEYIKDC